MISVYDIGNTAFDKNGDVVLTPTSAKVHIVAAGQYDMTLEHPIDDTGKWAHLQPEAVIRSPIPAELIENAFAGMDVDVYKTTTDNAPLREEPQAPQRITYSGWTSGVVYSAGSKVTSNNNNYQCTQSHMSEGGNAPPSAFWTPIANYTAGAPVLVNLKTGADLYFEEDYNTNWYKMGTPYGLEGYILKSQVTYDRHLTPSETHDRLVTEQLFRIKAVSVDTKARKVSVTAEHVSYDLAGVLMNNINIVRKPPAQSIAWLESAFMIEYPGTIASNITEAEDRTFSADMSGKNAMYALMDPDKGVVAQFEAAFRRDNWDLFVMEKVNRDQGFRITYGNNMLGVSWKIGSDNLITRIVPVAKDEDGNDLYLVDDDSSAPKWIDSEYIDDYPVIRMERIKVEGQVGKDDGTETATNWTKATLRAEMEKQAQARFDVDKCDQLKHEITIDFVRLGDTDEYRQFRDLQEVRLYDSVKAVDPRVGLSVSVQVVEIEFDAVNERITALKLSNIEAWNLENVTGFNVLNNSITSNKLTDDVTDGIGRAATKDANIYTDGKISGLNGSLRTWVTANFEPKS